MIPLVDLAAQHKAIIKDIESTISNIIAGSKFILGEEVLNFEKEFASYCENNFCVGTSNGTSALYTSLKMLGIKQGDEVLIPVNTFIATAFAVTMCGATPVFVDVNKSDALIDAGLIESLITKNTKAIIPVHLYGNVCNMDKIMDIARRYNLKIIEDCAQSHGAIYNGKKAPNSGIGCFSFFPAKILGAMGDAGAIVLSDSDLEKKCRKFINHGREEKYLHDVEGFNFRLDALQAAILSLKLKHLDSWIEKRKALAKKYDEKLQMETLNQPTSSYYMYVLLSDKRDALKEYLKSNGIETGIHYPIPLHLQPAFSHLNYKLGDFPVAELISKRLLSIPLFPELTDENQEKVIQAIRNFN